MPVSAPSPGPSVIHDEVLTGPRNNNLFAVVLLVFGMIAPAVATALLASSSAPDWMVVLSAAVLGPLWFVASSVGLSHYSRYRVRIGADGVHLRRAWKRYSRFVSWAEIDTVAVHNERIELRLHDGEQVFVAPLVSTERHPQSVLQLPKRLHAALMTFRAMPRAQRAELLGPSNQSLAQWRTRVREVADAVGYRNPALSRDELLQTLEDPAAPPGVRVGAALALDASASSQERQRIRVAAESTAAPKARVALELLGEEDVQEASLNDALEALRSDAPS